MSLQPQQLESDAKSAIQDNGYQVGSIRFVIEGQSHHNFRVTTPDGQNLFARFEKPGSMRDSKGGRRDFHFNGPLSLNREFNLLSFAREIGLPAPRVLGIYMSELGPFLMEEAVTGVYWSTYIREKGYSARAFLGSLKHFGGMLAIAHQATFESFGDVIGKDEVQPGNIHYFPERLEMIMNLKLDRSRQKAALSENEQLAIEKYTRDQYPTLRKRLSHSALKPVFNITDLHPMNFLVGENGNPTGLFDLETCQAATPSLDLYAARAHLLPYFENTHALAEESFFEGYRESGGTYDTADQTTQEVEYLLGFGHLLTGLTAYFGTKDGLRDTWSDQYRAILFQAMANHWVDYLAMANITRSKTRHPVNAVMDLQQS